MSSLNLLCTLCKDCGVCCFSCEFLDPKKGCTNEEYRINSRCSSFPIIFGIPQNMGYDDLSSLSLEPKNKDQKKWFFYPLDQCLILQNELLFNALRWVLADTNSEKVTDWFFLQIGDVRVDFYLT